jgi:hypothetical protein
VLLNPDEARFAGEAIPIRNLVIIGGLSGAFPVLYWTRAVAALPGPAGQPVFVLFLARHDSQFVLPLQHFDPIPHFHGMGAVSLVLVAALGMHALSAVGVANVVHLLLEAHEYHTDLLFGTHNVRAVRGSPRARCGPTVDLRLRRR